MSDAEWLAFEASPLVQRLDRRRTEPIGVIDVRHPQAHYARIAGWIAERFPLLIELAQRHGSSEQDGPGYDGLPYSSSAVLSPSDKPAPALNTESHIFAPNQTSPHASKRYPDSETTPAGRFRVARPAQALAASMEATESAIPRASSAAVDDRPAKSAVQRVQGLELSPVVQGEVQRSQTPFFTRSVGTPEPEIPSVPRASSQPPDSAQFIAGVTAYVDASAPFPGKVEGVMPRDPSPGFTHLPEQEGEGNAAALGQAIAVVHESLEPPTTKRAQTIWRVRRSTAGPESMPPAEPLSAISTEPGTLSRMANEIGESLLPRGEQNLARGVETLLPSNKEERNETYSSSQGKGVNEKTVGGSLADAGALLLRELPTDVRTAPLVLRRPHTPAGRLAGEEQWGQEHPFTGQSSRQDTSRLHTGITEHPSISRRIPFAERPRLRLSKREWAQLVERLTRVIKQKLAIDLERRGIRVWR
jgi:hypothetical protein